MRKQIIGIVLAFGLSACTQHDATDPVADVDRSELAGSYEYMAFFDGSFPFCEYAWLELEQSGSFVLNYNVLYDVAEPCSAHQAEAEMDEVGGWEGTYANLGTYLALESPRQYVVDETGMREYFDIPTDLTGSYDPQSGDLAVQFTDAWGFGEGGEGGSKTGGKDEGSGLSDLLFVRQ